MSTLPTAESSAAIATVTGRDSDPSTFQLTPAEAKTIRVLHPDRSIEEDARSLAGQFETLRTQDSRRLDVLAQYASDSTPTSTINWCNQDSLPMLPRRP